MSQQPTYDFSETLPDLDGGVLLEKISRAVRDVATSTVAHGDKGRKGEVTLKLTFDRIGESSQVNCTHKLSYLRLTNKGKQTEENTTETQLYVNRHGALSILPQSSQGDWLQQQAENEG